MRLVFPLMLIAVGLVLVGFVIQNPSQTVDLTIGSRQYSDVSLAYVAFVALAVGVGFTAVVALIEGATIRLANRKLRREIQRLRDEQGLVGSRSEPTASTPRAGGSLDLRGGSPGGFDRPTPGRPASAPVYDPGAVDPATRGD